MKSKIITSLFFLLIIIFVKGQFVINFANPATYQVDCGNVVSSQWSVKNQTCALWLPPLILMSSSSLTVNYEMRINQSGNLDPEDKVTVYYKINSGAWIVDSIISGDNTNAVRTISGIIPISVADTIHFKLSMGTNASNEFWSVKSGDIKMLNVTPIYFPLPVELNSFKGYYSSESNSNIITWSTITEVNNQYFTLLRSTDGKNYTPVTYIKGAGNSNKPLNYEFEDREITPLTYYYKLTQTDYDGTTKEFDPIVVESNSESANIQIHNNATLNNGLQVVTYSAKSCKVIARLYSFEGQLLYSNSINLETGMNIINIELGNNSSSMAILQLNDENNYSINKKILIAR